MTTAPHQSVAEAAPGKAPRHVKPAGDRRLIEEWLPIVALGIESLRERTPMTPFPAPNRLHVWWARRPLVASRAAVLASLLPADADRDKFMHILGIHGDPVAAKLRMARAGKNIDPTTGTRENLGPNPYGYDRAFKYRPNAEECRWMQATCKLRQSVVLDPTAGGGSIPFEAMRFGCTAIANDLNPVAWLLLKATVDFPARFGAPLLRRYEELSGEFMARTDHRFSGMFGPEPPSTLVDGYLWARTITCPYCAGLIPLSPNWRLKGSTIGVRLDPQTDDPKHRICHFQIVKTAADHSPGTVAGGDAQCCFPDCNRVIDGDEIKRQALAGQMGDQLYAIVYTERKVVGYSKNGKPKLKKVRGFRAPRPQDDVSEHVAKTLAQRMSAWEANGVVPHEEVPVGHKTGDAGGAGSGTDKPLKVGMARWRDMFSPRQLLGHCTSVEVFHELVEESGGRGRVKELDAAALTYLALAIDKMLNYNARMVRWHANRQVVAGVFDRHDFSFKWSYAEMAPTVTGLGNDWATKQTGRALKELIELCGHESPASTKAKRDVKSQMMLAGTPNDAETAAKKPLNPSLTNPVIITCGSGDNLTSIEDGSVDAVVFDPPYYDNVMYAELADFFYVWLKRTAGLLFPEPFSDHLTDKDREAVANVAKFKDHKAIKGVKGGSTKKRAARDYQERMQGIFAECRRVLKPNGIMTLMFTHKASGAWDALAKGLVDAGFVITASWPINTEAEGSLHIKDKNAAKSTIFLVCRPREKAAKDAEVTYWEDVEPRVREVVRKEVEQNQAAGISGVDLYLSCFGPALQVFSEEWPIKRGRAVQKPPPAKGVQLDLIEDDDWDPYAVHPEDALMAARSAVKAWRLEQLSKVKRRSHVDPVTEWFVLAWDAFRSPEFPADEALKLARVVGLDFDAQLRNKILEVKTGSVILWDSETRARKGTLGSVKSGVQLDALHHAANLARVQNLEMAKQMIEGAELVNDPVFVHGLDFLLHVLPTPGMVSGTGHSAGAAKDGAALEQLRRLMFNNEVPQADQWVLFQS